MSEPVGQAALPEGRAREDLETLYAAALRVAVDSITQRSGFPPFGLVVRSDGRLAGLRAEVTGAVPTTGEVLLEIYTGLQRRAGAQEIRACVVATDLSIQHPTGGPPDAVRLAFEMVDAEPVCLAVPYVPDRGPKGEPELAPAFAVPPEPQVFVG